MVEVLHSTVGTGYFVRPKSEWQVLSGFRPEIPTSGGVSDEVSTV